ncbi:UNVERIFIED_CONTAM: putative LRR receptor-like serine/threonine-protein kinase [Sesamum angustifolium]|uniref:LRR receptor-like serine/threonine-protein kinase n=1 Tax=Sesamum angustifolium TaxID=2727405 RepID=A0AAW2JN28_9LAMI
MEQHYFSLFSLLLFSALIGTTFSYQDGFLSLTCGGMTSYVDSSNISWTPDGYYVNTGNTTTVVFPEGTSSTSLPVRFFPDSAGRKCYRLPIQNTSSLVLVRTQFVYKNYDGLGKPPVFSVSLGTAMTTTVNLAHTDPWIEEFIWPGNKDVLPLCFHSIPNGGFPVISSLELRPLPPGAYVSAFGDSNDKLLRKSYRINCGYNDGPLRYPLDPYDRIWDADEDFSPYHVSAGFDVESNFSLSNIKESPPIAVLQTGRVLARWNNLVYRLPLDNQGDYHVVLYFAGILPVSPSFDVIINGEVVQSNYTVMQWEANSLFFTVKGIKTLNITLKTICYYPLVNALEVYEILDIPLEASSTTVSALQVIQHSTGLDLGWQDDPCSPKPWDHIGCDGNLVTSLKLFDVALRTISPTFGDLLDLKALDLHNTSLAGEIQNLGGLQHLEKLNLSFNQITSFGSELEDLINIQVLLLYLKRKRGEKTYTQRRPIDMQSWNSARVFTYKEIKAITNNFKEAIGRGSFGCVYIGKLPGLSFITDSTPESPVIGRVLLRVKQQILVYEYLPGGSLADNLYGANSKKLTLSWVRRLKIAVDAAKGLDYLHNGSDLRIIHRDVKSSNILLDMEMNAKVSDFGLSKQVTQSDASHVTTVVKGTAGYLDPEYYSTQQLTEKSDVYSFGVVLLELICGREPLTHTGTPDSFNLVLWAKPYLQAGAFEIVDESIKGSFDAESMRRAALIACRAVERDAMRRPTISEVLAELKEAYSLQIAYLAYSGLVN